MDFTYLLNELHKEREAITSVINTLEALAQFQKQRRSNPQKASSSSTAEPHRRKRGRSKGSRNRPKGSDAPSGA